MEFDDGLDCYSMEVLLLHVRAKHIRAEVLNSNTLAVNPYPRYRSLSRSLLEGKISYEVETNSEGESSSEGRNGSDVWTSDVGPGSECETRQRGLQMSLQSDCLLAGSTRARYSQTMEYPLPCIALHTTPSDKVNANAQSSQLTRQTLSLKTAMTASLSPVYRTLATNLLIAPDDHL